MEKARKLRLLFVLICCLALTVCLSSFGFSAFADEAGKVLYYVDCGNTNNTFDADETKYGLALGTKQTTKDQTWTDGQTWGKLVGEFKNVDKAYTDSVVEGAKVSYKFAVDAGTYRVAIGFNDSFSTSKTAKITINGNVVNESFKVVDVIATNEVADNAGVIQVDVDALEAEKNVAISYIIVEETTAKTLTMIKAYENETVTYLKNELPKAYAYYSTGVEKLNIKYSKFDTPAYNKLFATFDAEGVVEGYEDIKVAQKIVVLPENIKYFINLGGDINDGYHNAALRNNPSIINMITDKEYADDYGYVKGPGQPSTDASYKNSDGVNNIYESCRYTYPSQPELIFDYKMNIDDGKYDIYIGTFCLWYARPTDIYVNTELKLEKYDISPEKKFALLEDNDITGGCIHLSLNSSVYGPGYDPVASFYVVTDADETAAPEAPVEVQSKDLMELTDTKLDLAGLTVGNKVELYDTNTNRLIYQFVADAETATVEFTDEMLNGIVSMSVVQLNAGGVSPIKIVKRTDIKNAKLEVSKDWTAKELPVKLTAHSDSGINKLEVVAKDFNDSIVFDTPIVDFDYTYMIKTNANYDFILYSVTGGISKLNANVTNIDMDMPVITFKINTAANATPNNVTIDFIIESKADLSSMKLLKDNKEFKTLKLDDKSFTFTEPGKYTLVVNNVVNKTISKTIYVSLSSKGVFTNAVLVTENGKNSIEYKINKDYELDNVVAYSYVGDKKAERMNVNTDSMKYFKDGKFVAMVTLQNGEQEILITDLTPPAKQPVSPWVGFGTGLGIGIVVIVGVALLLKLKFKLI